MRFRSTYPGMILSKNRVSTFWIMPQENAKENRMQFDSLDDIRTFCRDLPAGDPRFADIAAHRQQNLTKPPGSLGRLEELAIWLAQWQGRERRGSIASPLPCSPAIMASPRAASRPIRQPSPRRWWRISPPAAPPSTRSPDLPAPSCAWCRSNSSGRRAISPKLPRWIPTSFSARSTKATAPCPMIATCSLSARWV